MRKLYHSPKWYWTIKERHGWEDMFHQNTRKMLKNDLDEHGGDFDSTMTDEENLCQYEEFYGSEEFLKNMDPGDMAQVELDDMLEIDPGAYHVLMRGLDAGEEEYDRIVDKCAANILAGKDNILRGYLKKIRKETQRRINPKLIAIKKKKAKAIGMTAEMKPIQESPYHTWNNPFGDKKDYEKELLNHRRSILLCEAVDKKVAELFERRKDMIKVKLEGRLEREKEVKEKALSYPELSTEQHTSISKSMKVSVSDQESYLDDTTEPNKED